MVRLRQIGRDQYELDVGDRTFLFSYGAPVAVVDKKDGVKYESSDDGMTITTQRHVMNWMARVEGEPKTLKQWEIENLLERKA